MASSGMAGSQSQEYSPASLECHQEYALRRRECTYCLDHISADFDDSYETQDGVFDVAWSEIHENQIISASGDGSIKLWDITLMVSDLLAGRSSTTLTLLGRITQ